MSIDGNRLLNEAISTFNPKSVLFCDVGSGEIVNRFSKNFQFLQLPDLIEVAEPDSYKVTEIFDQIKDLKDPRISVKSFKVEKYVLLDVKFHLIITDKVLLPPTVLAQKLFDLKSLGQVIILDLTVDTVSLEVLYALAAEHFTNIQILSNYMVLS